jgi:hypothetical protein
LNIADHKKVFKNALSLLWFHMNFVVPLKFLLSNNEEKKAISITIVDFKIYYKLKVIKTAQ